MKQNLSDISDTIPYIGKDSGRIEGIFQSKGLQKGRAVYLTTLLEEDWNKCDEDEEKKFWALEHGFLPGRIKLYNLNQTNYLNYLSDMDYFRLHPINNHFAIWINDKLTLKYVIPSVFLTLEGRKLSIMPEYYLYIENDGRYSYLMDSPQWISHNKDYLFNLLKQKGKLALKPSKGAGGHGFVMLEYIAGDLYVNFKKLNKSAFDEFIESLNGYLVMEYVEQHKALNPIWSKSVCTLRVIALKRWDNNFDSKVDIIVSYARFGTSKSHGASNLSSGGVAIPFDFNTGRFGEKFYQYQKYAIGGEISFMRHPDTNVSLTGEMLPNWEIIRDTVFSVCNYLSSLEYFGFDLMVTNDGVKMCEINTHPSLDYEQIMCGPIMLKKEAKEFFEMKLRQKI